MWLRLCYQKLRARSLGQREVVRSVLPAVVAVVESVNGLKYLLEFGKQLVVLLHSFTPVSVPLGRISALPLGLSHPYSPLAGLILPILSPFPASGKHALLKFTLGYPRLHPSFSVLLGIAACGQVVVSILGGPQRASLANWGDRGRSGKQSAREGREQVRGQLEVV
jgi:hypothetical protein